MVCIFGFAALAEAPATDLYPGKEGAELERLRGQLDGVFRTSTFGDVLSVRDNATDSTYFNALDSGVADFRALNESITAPPFYLGFDIMRDFDFVGDPDGAIMGTISVDGYGQIHTFPLPPIGEGESPTGIGPHLNYYGDVAAFNSRPQAPAGSAESTIATDGTKDVDVYLPFFFAGDSLFDIARDVELAVDWRRATNAWQGTYILDGWGGVHYINDGEVLAMMKRNGRSTTAGSVPGQKQGQELFFDLFGFRPLYSQDYRGADPASGAPYFGWDIARDLEVAVRWMKVSTTDVAKNDALTAQALNLGIDLDKLSSDLRIDSERADPNNTRYGEKVAITTGYCILDGFGTVHSMLEDEDGNPVPAAWEDPITGAVSTDLVRDIPWFGTDIAVDIELLPGQNGFVLLTVLGEVFVIPGLGLEMSDVVNPDAFDEPPEESTPFFGYNVARGLKLVTGADGKLDGFYVLDAFGTIHEAGEAPKIPQFGGGATLPPYDIAVSNDIEISPFYTRVSTASAGL